MDMEAIKMDILDAYDGYVNGKLTIDPNRLREHLKDITSLQDGELRYYAQYIAVNNIRDKNDEIGNIFDTIMDELWRRVGGR